MSGGEGGDMGGGFEGLVVLAGGFVVKEERLGGGS